MLAPARRAPPAALLALVIVAGGLLGAGYYFLAPMLPTWSRLGRLRAYLQDPSSYADWELRAGERVQMNLTVANDGSRRLEDALLRV